MVLGESSYQEGDLERFPEEHSYRERNRRGIGGAMSLSFRDAVRLANHRVWLLDEQLLRHDSSVCLLVHLLSGTNATDIIIVTASKEGAAERASWLKDLERELQDSKRTAPPRIRVSLDLDRNRDVPEIHDRFAVIDDVLWHCGATVGGLHHAINAITFGWSAHTTHAIGFFVQLFKVLRLEP